MSKRIAKLGRKHDLSKVFNDLLSMSICSYHSDNIRSRLQEKNADNEILYMSTIAGYSDDELGLFVECLAYLGINASENPYSDILGEYFTQNITKGQNGQFFTPDPICKLMSMMTLDLEGSGKRIFDPACGSGRMLLNAAKKNHRNYFFGADNTVTCAKMATLNFFLNGLTGEVAWMNSLTMEWYGGWQINTNGIGILPIEKEQSQIWSEAPKSKSQKPIEDMDIQAGKPATQLSMF